MSGTVYTTAYMYLFFFFFFVLFYLYKVILVVLFEMISGGSLADVVEKNKKDNEVMGEGELKQLLIQIAEVI